MPIFEDFSRNGELLQVRDEPLHAANLPRYIKVNSKERAEGYLEALENALSEIDKVLVERFPDSKEPYEIPQSGASVEHGFKKILANKLKFLQMSGSTVPDMAGLPYKNYAMLLEGFFKNRHLVESENKPNAEKDFERYKEQFGIEKANGYFDAVRDIANELEDVVFYQHGSLFYPESASLIRTKGAKLYSQKLEFVTYGKKFIDDLNNVKPTDTLEL